MERELVRLGFTPARPLMPARYDILAERDGRVYRIQTKTGRIESRNGTLKASWDTPYTPDEVDIVAVVDTALDGIYWLEVSRLAGVQGVTIRFSESQRESSGFMASEVTEFPFKREEGEG